MQQIYTNRSISQTEILLAFILWPSIIIKRFSSGDRMAKTQSVGLTHSSSTDAHRASGQLNTTLPSLAMVVRLSLLILLAQRAAVRPSLSKTIHAHHHTKTMTETWRSQRLTHSLPSQLEHNMHPKRNSQADFVMVCVLIEWVTDALMLSCVCHVSAVV